MHEIRFHIVRGNGGNSFSQEYRLPYLPNKTLFWWLTRIQEELDSSLAFPVSCRAGLCGGCGIVINDRSVLSCETMVDAFLRGPDEDVFLQPLRGFPVIRDLIVDWRSAAERMKELLPRDFAGQQIAMRADTRLQMEAGHLLMNLGACITCGICVSECPAIAGGSFPEPYIFVKCRMLAEDPRIGPELKADVVKKLRPYFSQCIECGRCAAACPRRVSPLDAIAFLSSRFR